MMMMMMMMHHRTSYRTGRRSIEVSITGPGPFQLRFRVAEPVSCEGGDFTQLPFLVQDEWDHFRRGDTNQRRVFFFEASCYLALAQGGRHGGRSTAWSVRHRAPSRRGAAGHRPLEGARCAQRAGNGVGRRMTAGGMQLARAAAIGA